MSHRILYFIFFLMAPSLLFLQMHQRPERTSRQPDVITLTAIAGLQFDKVRFSVMPGTPVKIILKNSDDMSHNLVFTRPGKRLEVVNAASKLEEDGPRMNYIPDTPDVLWSIPVLSPGQEQSLTFVSPEKPGIYPFVCTFPGHGFVMYGAMYVSFDEKLPPLEADPNVPASVQKKNTHNDHSETSARVVNHPYTPEPPYLYRAYMAESGPASIAVHLPGKLSYCWDAGECVLRYAWDGEFVDNSGLWKGKPNAVAKILGTIFYRNKRGANLLIGDHEKSFSPEFKGYRMIDRYPEFHYSINGVDVFELIKPTENAAGLVRTFRIPEAPEHVWFKAGTDDGVLYAASAGKMTNNSVRLSPEQARQFSITITQINKGK